MYKIFFLIKNILKNKLKKIPPKSIPSASGGVVKWRRRVKRQCCLSPTWHMSIKIFPKFLQSKTTKQHSDTRCFVLLPDPSQVTNILK
jgi:hypothetical protein